jgi:hypothetical protein
MRVMVLHKSLENWGEKIAAPTPEMLEAFEAMDGLTEEMVKAGIFVAGAGLQNGSNAKRLGFDGKEHTVVDGPFAESKELVAGYSIWQVKDMDEAIAWAKRAPMIAGSEVEIRPFYEAEDLGEFVKPEELAKARDGDRGKFGVA